MRLRTTAPARCFAPRAAARRDGAFRLPAGLAAALASLALAASTSCGGGAAKKGGPEAVPVRVAPVEQRDVPFDLSAIGHVDPSSTVAVKPRVGGAVTEVHFREGDDVEKGKLLFVIDPRPFEAALSQARANVARDRARATEAERTLARYQELVGKEYITQEQFDQARADVEALHATVQGDEASIEQARLNLEYCRITAPESGRTGSLLVYPGNVVAANDARPLVVINRIEPVFVSFSVPESVLGEVKSRSRTARLEVTATTPDGTTHRGELTFIDNAVDPQTGTIQLKATFPNRTRGLWPGQFVTTALTLYTDAKATVVPSEAVQKGQEGPHVWVVKDDLKAESRPVKVSRTWHDLALVTSGLAPGERVVTDGQIRLAPGATVSVKKDAAATAGTGAEAAAGGTP